MTYLTEFSNFASSNMPVIPAGFIDQSWHNDTMPHWEHDALRVSLWIDHEDPKERECDAGFRFALYDIDADGAFVGNAFFQSDNWPEVERAIFERMASHLAAQSTPKTPAPRVLNFGDYSELNASPLGQKIIAAGFSIYNSGGNIMLWAKEYPAPHNTCGNVLAYLAQSNENLGEDGREDAWECSAQDDNGAIDAFNFSGTLSACLSFLARFCPAYCLADELTEDAINFLARKIQDALGVETGDAAGIFFSGDENRKPIADIIRAYVCHEAIHADERE